MTTYTIEQRRKIVVNTDPQRRCYNGCHAKSEERYTEWEWLELDVPEDRLETHLNYWRELNDYAISERGESARCEYRAVPI